MTDKLLLNPGTFIHLVRESDDDEFFLENDTSVFAQYNPMGLRFREVVTCYEEDHYGVNDLYVLVDKYNTLWGVTVYRGLGKHDENHEIFEYSTQADNAVHDEQVRESMEEYPLELFELVRKTTYKYDKR